LIVSVGERVEAIAIAGLPVIRPGDDLAALIAARAPTRADGEVLVVASKLVSRAEDRFVDLGAIEVSARAQELARTTGHAPAHVEVILRESIAVSRAARGVLITRHRLGFVVANAGVDFSNVGRDGGVLLLPVDPDASAARIAATLGCAVVISDSFGRPFRRGSIGTAIGVAGLPALHDQRGRVDLFGRALEHTETALADQVAAIADLVLGQADEARGAAIVRGLRFAPARSSARELLRPIDEDLYG
jgi:coenzyme F420-0:L-glutamate ligase/coenzyme F420-1:gamma-L-glutamate ligase